MKYLILISIPFFAGSWSFVYTFLFGIPTNKKELIAFIVFLMGLVFLCFFLISIIPISYIYWK